MSKAGISFEVLEKELLENEEVKNEIDNLKLRYDIIAQMIEARKEQGITQAELAKRCGTQKSHISRMESGNYNPTLDFLIKIAKGMGKELHLTIR